MPRKLTFLIVLLIVCCSCTTLKTARLMKSGAVSQETFYAEIPFERRLDLIILKVSIEGEEYDFILDTGAPNVLSKELAGKLNIKKSFENHVGDSQGKKEMQQFGYIDEIKIGELSFMNTGIVVTDLNASSEIACFGIDGIIGANLMRKAIWHFDFQKQIITITNNEESISSSSEGKKVPFSQSITGTPKADIRLNDTLTVKRVTIDTGSNGEFSLPRKKAKELAELDSSFQVVEAFGSASSGLYGVGEADTLYYAIVNSTSIGETALNNTLIDFDNLSKGTIGMKFFEHYDLIFNWEKEEMRLIERSTFIYDSLSTFGFRYRMEEGALLISKLYETSSAQQEGVLLDDRILSIGGVNTETIGQDDWCEIMEDKALRGVKIFEGKDNLKLRVLRDEKELEFDLERKRLL